MGHSGAGIAALRRAVVLDPLSSTPYGALGEALYTARRYGEAVPYRLGEIRCLLPGSGKPSASLRSTLSLGDRPAAEN
jgi:hypothetical protein